MKKKRSKKAIAICLLVMLFGIIFILISFWGDLFLSFVYSEFDPSVVTSEDVGKSFVITYQEDMLEVDENGPYIVTFYKEIGDEEYLTYFYVFDVSKLDSEERYIFETCIYGDKTVNLKGVLRELDNETYIKATEVVTDYFDEIYDILYEAYGENIFEVSKEELIAEEISTIAPYYFEITDVVSFNGEPFLIIGIVSLFVGLLLLICFVFKLKKRIVLPIVFAVVVVLPSVLFFNQLRMLLSMKKVDPGFYTAKNYVCTDTSGMLEADISSIDEFITWTSNRHYHGVVSGIDIEDFGCSAFSCSTPQGEHLFGRNFDFDETDAMLIYSHPEGCYASLGMADTSVIGVGRTATFSGDSPIGRFIMTVLPYVVLDGVNEMGLGCGILQLDIDEVHQDNGNPDLLIYCAIRGILDNCASVDEAIEFLGNYDIHTGLNVSYHLFITDRSGRSVVVEWLDGEMVVTEINSVTNYIVAPGDYDRGEHDRRHSDINNELSIHHDSLTADEAMHVLNIASQEGFTEWSCVYNLDNFSVDICLDGNYHNVYTFSASDFE